MTISASRTAYRTFPNVETSSAFGWALNAELIARSDDDDIEVPDCLWDARSFDNSPLLSVETSTIWEAGTLLLVVRFDEEDTGLVDFLEFAETTFFAAKDDRPADWDRLEESAEGLFLASRPADFARLRVLFPKECSEEPVVNKSACFRNVCTDIF